MSPGSLSLWVDGGLVFAEDIAAGSVSIVEGSTRDSNVRFEGEGDDGL